MGNDSALCFCFIKQHYERLSRVNGQQKKVHQGVKSLTPKKSIVVYCIY